MTKYLYIGILSFLFLAIQGCGDSDSNKEPADENSSTTDAPKNDSVAQPEVHQDLAELVPEGFSIFDKIYGDLNKDGISDTVFIVKEINPDNIVDDEYQGKLDRNRRGIIIFLSENNTWKLAIKNMDCFSSENEDGGVYFAPELGVNIRKGNLYVNYGHGRYGNWGYTFRMKNDDFELIGYDSSDNYGPRVDRETSINFLTSKKLVRTNTNEGGEGNGDEVFEEEWTTVEAKALLKLSKIGDFDGLSFY